MVRNCAPFALLSVVAGETFPDTLVDVRGQPSVAGDLVGAIMDVPTWDLLERHLDDLARTPSFTKHMNVLQGDNVIADMASLLNAEIDLGMRVDELNQCAQDSSCLSVWTTDSSLMGRSVQITEVIGSWNMTESAVGQVCHVQKHKDTIFCHRPGDAYKSGVSWLAFAVPVDAPMQMPQPVAVRCHDKGPKVDDTPCHLLAGHEFMAARLEHIQLHDSTLSMTSSKSLVASLGWCSYCSPAHVGAHGIRAGRTNAMRFGPGDWTGLCLTAPNGVSTNGAPVEMWTCDESSSQNWIHDGEKLRFSGDGRLTHCLDVPGGEVFEDATVWLWECYDGSTVQSFEFRPVRGAKSGQSSSYGIHQLVLPQQIEGEPDWCVSFYGSAGEPDWSRQSRVNGTNTFLQRCLNLNGTDVLNSHQRWSFGSDVMETLI